MHLPKNDELHHKLQQTKLGQRAVSEVVTVLKKCDLLPVWLSDYELRTNRLSLG